MTLKPHRDLVAENNAQIQAEAGQRAMMATLKQQLSQERARADRAERERDELLARVTRLLSDNNRSLDASRRWRRLALDAGRERAALRAAGDRIVEHIERLEWEPCPHGCVHDDCEAARLTKTWRAAWGGDD